jgi:hypothetical protein
VQAWIAETFWTLRIGKIQPQKSGVTVTGMRNDGRDFTHSLREAALRPDVTCVVSSDS